MVDTVIDYLDRPTAIFGAAYSGYTERLEELLSKKEYKDKINHPVNSQGDHTPLFFACYGDANAETVVVLLKNGADPLHRDNIGRTLLHMAANTWDPEILKALLDIPELADLVDDAAKITGQTPFHALCLPKSGAGDKKAKNADAYKCLQRLLYKSYHSPLEALSVKDKNGLTPIMLAKHYENPELLLAFQEIFGQDFIDSIELPADIESLLTIDFYGRTKLLEAAFVNNKEDVSNELAKLVDPDQFNIQSGRNALHLACGGIGDAEMVSMILAKIKEPLAGDLSGERTALHLAANSGREDTVKVLLENEIISKNINILDGNNRTALHALAMAGSRISSREKTIDLLFEKSIDYNARDANGDTALGIAEARSNTVVANRIKLCIAVNEAKEEEKEGQSFIPGFAALHIRGNSARALRATSIDEALGSSMELDIKKLSLI